MKTLFLFLALAVFPSLYVSASDASMASSTETIEWTAEASDLDIAPEKVKKGDDDPVKPFHRTYAKELVKDKFTKRQDKYNRAGEIAYEVVCVAGEILLYVAIEVLVQLIFCS